MTSVLLLPDPAVLTLVSIEINKEARMITATAKTTGSVAHCPACGQEADRVHSHYVRTLADLPCSGQCVRWLVQVRRFFCKKSECSRRIFTERLPSCAPAYARRTLKQAESLCEVAFATGGRPGARLTPFLGMEASHDTLIRLMRRTPVPCAPTPRILGVDDFAFRRGQRWGTILIDQESHQVIDLLPDREGPTFLAWLQAHSGVEIVSRDRASAYADAARAGAPEATQVADRFHLLLNLRKAVQRLLERKHASLPKETSPGQAPPDHPEGPERQVHEGKPDPESVPPEPPGTLKSEPMEVSFIRDTQREKQYHQSYQDQKQARQARRQARFEEARDLYRQGVSIHAISRTMGLCRVTIRKYIYAEQDTLPSPPVSWRWTREA
jgi:transposase